MCCETPLSTYHVGTLLEQLCASTMNACGPCDESMFASPTSTHCPCDEFVAFATNTCDPCEMVVVFGH